MLRGVDPHHGRVGDAVRYAPIEQHGCISIPSGHVLVDRALEEQVHEQRRVAVGRAVSVDRALFREDLPGGLTHAADISADGVEDRCLPRARGAGEDMEVSSAHRERALPAGLPHRTRLLRIRVTDPDALRAIRLHDHDLAAVEDREYRSVG